ncbi:hypothetical protein CCP2SC5_220031 [Azospirillaceae bacterium]
MSQNYARKDLQVLDLASVWSLLQDQKFHGKNQLAVFSCSAYIHHHVKRLTEF